MNQSSSQSLKVHQAIAQSLADNGVDTLFGLMGDANMFMVDSFVRRCGGTFVAAAHEAGAALMALGYACLSGKAGIATVTHGPALTNTVTALVEGVKGAVPAVLICGDTTVEDREHNQNIAQREFIVAAGAGFEQLRSPRTVTQDVLRALRRAIVERRPVALNVPAEFDWSEVAYRPARLKIPESRAIVPASDDLDTAIGILAVARRPLVLVGRGAVSPEARSAVLKLARRLEAPIATTLKAKDLFRDEDCNLGIFGTASTPAAVDIIIESDCIIAFGASLNRYTTSHGTFVKGKRVIQVNLEPEEVGKNVVPDAGLVGDPAGMAEIIIRWLDEAEIPPSGFCTDELKQRIAAGSGSVASRAIRGGTVDFRSALARVDRILPAERTLVTDGGRFMIETWTRVAAPGPSSFLSTVNFSSIGLGLSYGIGASFATQGRPTVVITGDGGFMHGGLVELNTAVRYKRDLIIVVCNDGAYGAEHVKFRNREMDPASVLFEWPDFAPIAIALGADGVTVKSEGDWAQVEAAITKRSRPLLIDVKLDPEGIS